MSNSIILRKDSNRDIAIFMEGGKSVIENINVTEPDFNFMDELLGDNGFIRITPKHKTYNPILRIFYRR